MPSFASLTISDAILTGWAVAQATADIPVTQCDFDRKSHRASSSPHFPSYHPNMAKDPNGSYVNLTV